jgi:hypothetical protein
MAAPEREGVNFLRVGAKGRGTRCLLLLIETDFVDDIVVFLWQKPVYDVYNH